jgi:hypothetical protein
LRGALLQQNETEKIMYERDSGTETLRDRLAAIDHRIARMRSLNATQGDALAVKLIEHAEVERRALLKQLPPAEKA